MSRNDDPDFWQKARRHLIRYGGCFLLMIVLAMVDLRVWMALSYPVYAVGIVLLVLVAAKAS